MIMQEILDIFSLIDRPGKVAESVANLFTKENISIQIKEVKGKNGLTQFVKIVIPGKSKGPTLGIIGRLGGIGARPERIGFVSDGDGALTALSVALRLARMRKNGDVLEGDIIITTHLCTNAPTIRHEPVPFMGSPVDIATMNKYEVYPQMEAILSIDTSRGNKIINTNGFAITPTVKEGWILKVSDDLVRLAEHTSGSPAAFVPITMQDITPYGNGIYHFNSIMQPAVTTKAPVVGVALTSILPVPGSATGATNVPQIDLAGRFVIEVAKEFTAKSLSFFDKKEYKVIQKIYGSMGKLQKGAVE